tara:strand:- start:1341 stop:2660 length:1320 start_codon:yes stop_codon:yes gene_type:complete
MNDNFKKLSSELFNLLDGDQVLTLSLSGENSHFCRLSQSKVRQIGDVLDTNISLSIIYDNRICHGGITLTNNFETDLKLASLELNRLKEEVKQLPPDPFLVMPTNTDSLVEKNEGSLLDRQDTVNSLTPIIEDVDLAGIWASGNIYRGCANSLGLFHWFETDTFSLDFSLITEDERMVKGTFAGNDWSQADYESYMCKSKEKLSLLKRDSIKLKPGEYRTYIAPAGVSDILDMFSWNGVGESSIRQGQSALIKLRNDGALSGCFSLTEDFTSGFVPRFNSIGEVSPKVLNIIDGGVLRNTLVSSRTAKEYSLKSNYADDGEFLRSPKINPGDLKEEEILKNLDEGLYLSNLHYLNWSDNLGGRITGMTRYACFWVQGGEIVAPIENMRFDDSIYNFFGNNLESVGEKAEFIPSVGTYQERNLGGNICPGILLSSFKLTL